MPRNPAPMDPERQLMIKTKTCQRLVKESAFYRKEVQENEQILLEMRNSNKDPYDIKRFEQVLAESLMMVPDSSKRLQLAFDELSTFVAENAQNVDSTGEWWITANALLNEHGKMNVRFSEDDDKVAETNVDDIGDDEVF